MNNLSSQLKDVTTATHRRIDGLPFHGALRTGAIERVSLVTFLQCLAIIYAALERELRQSSDPRLLSVWNRSHAKLDLLLADLKRLDPERKPSIAPAIACAVELAHDLAQNGNQNPISLLGALYVLEGSLNGGLHLKKMFSVCLAVSEDELSYYRSDQDAVASRWKTFTSALDQAETTELESQSITRMSLLTFSIFERIVASLHPASSSDIKYCAAAINPESGSHAVPKDEQLVELAYAAGKAAWDRFPYLPARFADRGLRFTESDSCWLVNLASLNRAAIKKNIFWLRSVLASRGLPTLILETHMHEILGRLRQRYRDDESKFDDFASIATELKNERLGQVEESRWLKLMEKFDPAFLSQPGYKISGATELICSAWADERSGVPHAFSATRDWFMDPTRFSTSWIESVRQLCVSLEAESK